MNSDEFWEPTEEEAARENLEILVNLAADAWDLRPGDDAMVRVLIERLQAGSFTAGAWGNA